MKIRLFSALVLLLPILILHLIFGVTGFMFLRGTKAE